MQTDPNSLIGILAAFNLSWLLTTMAGGVLGNRIDASVLKRWEQFSDQRTNHDVAHALCEAWEHSVHDLFAEFRKQNSSASPRILGEQVDFYEQKFLKPETVEALFPDDAVSVVDPVTMPLESAATVFEVLKTRLLELQVWTGLPAPLEKLLTTQLLERLRFYFIESIKRDSKAETGLFYNLFYKILEGQGDQEELLAQVLKCLEKPQLRPEAQSIYLEYLVECYSRDDPRGIHHTEGKLSTLPLNAVFVALDVEREREALPAFEETEHRRVVARERTTERLELVRAFREHGRLVVLGAPGMGKTTITKYLCGKLAEALLTKVERVRDEENNDFGAPALPVRFRIGDFAEALAKEPTLSIRQFLPRGDGNCRLSETERQALLHEALDSGTALVMMDGLDEIAAGEQRSKVANEIQDFVSGLHPQTRVLITSRIAGYREGARLGGMFAEFTLAPLNRAQIGLFLKKRCLAYEQMLNRGQERPQSHEMVTKAANDEENKILKAVDNPKNLGVKLLAQTPLLLMILALIHRNGNDLPNQRIKLYDLAVRVLLREWRIGQEVAEEHTVSESEALNLLAPLATYLHTETSNGRVGREQLLRFLKERRGEWWGVKWNHPENEKGVEDFLRRVEQHTGLFVETAPDEYGFLHLTFEEYFVARDLLQEEDADAMHRISNLRHQSRWIEPTRLAVSHLSSTRPRMATRFIRSAILGQGEGFAPSWGEPLLHRDVQLAGYCLADCENPDPPMVQEIGDKLIDLALNSEHNALRTSAAEVLAVFLVHDRERTLTTFLDKVKAGNATAASALGRLGVVRDDILSALLEQVRSGNGSAGYALGRLGVVRDDILSALLEQVKSGNGSAGYALGRLGVVRDDILSALLEQVRSGNGSAGYALGRFGVVRDDILSALLEQVRSGNGPAADALGGLGVVRDDILSALLEQVKSGNRSAADAFGALGVVRDDILSALLEQVRSGNGSAGYALGRLGVVRDDILSALLEQVKEGDWSAGYALRDLGIARADILSALLEQVRSGNGSAADALGGLGVVRDDILSALLEQVKEGDFTGMVFPALVKIVEKATNEGLSLPCIADW